MAIDLSSVSAPYVASYSEVGGEESDGSYLWLTAELPPGFAVTLQQSSNSSSNVSMAVVAYSPGSCPAAGTNVTWQRTGAPAYSQMVSNVYASNISLYYIQGEWGPEAGTFALDWTVQDMRCSVHAECGGRQYCRLPRADGGEGAPSMCEACSRCSSAGDAVDGACPSECFPPPPPPPSTAAPGENQGVGAWPGGA